ncbi:MAG TPA: hypothetical protein VFZ20_29685, partial [Longimicrobium sp.]
MKKHLTLAAACVLAASCTAPQAGPEPAAGPMPSTAPTADPNQQLDQLAEAYFEASLPLNPTGATSLGDTRFNHLYTVGFSPEGRAAGHALL